MRRMTRPLLLGLIALVIGFGVWILRARTVRPAPAVRTIAVTADARPAAPGPVDPTSGTGRATEPAPVVAAEVGAFDSWLEQYLEAPPAERGRLAAEGRRRAEARRAVMARLIREDPRAALTAAVPMVARQQLPPEIVAQLEERVAGRGTVALIGVVPRPGEQVPATYRSAMVSGREYRAYVFGRRDLPGTVERTSLHGVALDGHLAIAESPMRILEAGELAAGRPVSEICDVSGLASAPGGGGPFNVSAATAVEYNGVIHILCTAKHVPMVERQLLATEETPMTAASAGPGSSNVFGRPSREWTHGPKTVLIMRVDFSDRPGPPRDSVGAPFDETRIAEVMNVVAGFYRQNSFGGTDLVLRPTVQGDSPDVTPVLRMPRPSTYYNEPGFPRAGDLMDDALAAARAAGFAVDGYARVGLLQPYLENHLFSGQAQIGGRLAWYNGEFHFAVVAHEIGHNYGVVHANAWVVPDGNPVSAAGFSQEYRDWSDVMGGGHTTTDHFSQWHKSVLQWIPDEAVRSPTTSGTYRIYAFDEATPPEAARPRAIKLTRDAERDYWIGFRVASRLSAFANGASLIWGYQNVRSGDLLDLTPGSSGEYDDAALPIGSSFADPVARVTIRPVARGGDIGAQWLEVQISFAAGVAWSGPSFAAAESEGRVVLRVRRSRDFAGPLSVNWRTGNGTAVAGGDFTAANGTLSWAAGDASDRFITISLVADNVNEGAERFMVVLESPSGGNIEGSAQAEVLIGEAGVRDPSWATDYPRGLVNDLVALPNDDTVIVGAFDPRIFSSPPEFPHAGILKLAPDGTPLPGYAEGAGVGLNGNSWRVARLPDGRYLVGGDFEEVHGTPQRHLARLNADGSIDASFRPVLNGRVRSLLPLPDGQMLVGGEFTSVNGASRRQLVRLHVDGSVDPEFVSPAWAGSFDAVNCLAMQPDGRVLVGGVLSYVSPTGSRAGLLRLLPSGEVDQSFAPTSLSWDSGLGHVTAIVVQPDGRILVGGVFDQFNGVARGGLVRLQADGTVDPTFIGNTDGYLQAIQVLSADRVVIGGQFSAVNGQPVSGFAFLSADGALDAGAAALGGFAGVVYRFALLPSNRLQFIGEGHFPGPWEFRELWRMFTGVANGPGVVSFNLATVAGTEGGTVNVTATRTGGSSGEIVVPYATAIGTAGVNDFVATSGVLRWANGDSAPKTISVSLRTDGVGDPAETFTINLGPALAGGALAGAITQATVTIQPGPDTPQPPEESWNASDIGAVGVAGSASESGAQVTLRGSGADIWGAVDGFHFRSVRLTGDGTIVARVASLSNTHAWAKAGLMFREDTSAGSRNIFAYVTAGNHAGLQVRSENGGSTAVAADVLATMPQWLKLVRTGNSFAAFRSINGVDWIALGSTTCALPATVEVGLAVTSHNNSMLATAVFEQVQVMPVEPPTPPPAAVWNGADIGNVGQTGTDTGVASGAVTIQAAGADIWGSADGFRYVYRPWRGDGAVVARITRLDPTHSWAKAGLMFRESLQPGARNVMMLLTAGNAAGLQARTATSGSTTFAAGPRLAVPHWVRLVRQGDTFFGATSVDGINWTERGSVTVDLPDEILVGAAVTSHTVSARTTANFEQLAVVGEEDPPPPPPDPTWAQSNWGAGGGSFTAEANALSISARGADIWGPADDGMFVHQAVDGDGAITLRLDSLMNTHTWAKAGVMFRAGTAANAANIFLAVTPGAGLTFQTRASAGGGTVEIRRAWGITAPVWLRLTRTGDQFRAEYSTNGTAWTQLGVQNLVMPTVAEMGVAVSSHASAETTVSASNVEVP